jgi:hypothetical protein
MSERKPYEIRQLLEDAVSGVEPRPALDEILARTSRSTSRRRPWLWGAGGAVVATAAVVTAVAALGNGPASKHEAGPAGSTPTATTATVAVPAYFLGATSHGPRLYREFEKSSPSAAKGIGPLELAIGGKSADPDYRSLWPSGLTIASVIPAANGSSAIRVSLLSPPGGSLALRPAGMTAVQARLSIQQVVYTVQAEYKSTAPVRFLVDRHPATRLLGVTLSGPVPRAAALDVLAQVWVDNPTDGATVADGFKVTGLAAAFEANVQWELKQGGRVVKSGFTTARECCVMAPYSFTVHAAPGTYTLVVHDDDPSGGASKFAPWQDTKTITVR